MNTKIFSKPFIKNIFSDRIYQRGDAYFRNGRVIDLKYHSDDREWSAEVLGKHDDYEVLIEEYTDDVGYECSCPAYERSWECKHIVSVLLEINDRLAGGARELSSNNQRSREFHIVNKLIERFADHSSSRSLPSDVSLQKPLSVEFILKTQTVSGFPYDHFLTIEMKTGDKRLYVIKNLKELLQSINQHTAYFFTKNFSYNPVDHFFRSEDLEVINILQEISDNEQVYHNQLIPYQQRPRSSERELFIPPYAAESLLGKLKDRSLRLEHGDYSYQKIDIVSDFPPLLFQLEKSKQRSGAFKLDMNKLNEMTDFSSYRTLFNKGVFYKLQPDQQALYKEFREISRNSDLLIEEEQIEPFLAQVAPRLKKIGKLDIAASVADHIVSLPLQIKVLVDGTSDRLEVKMTYHYGEQIIDPFEQGKRESQENDRILIRDAEKERDVMAIIEDSTLKYDGNKLTVEGEEGFYDFLYGVLPKLQDKAEIYLTSAIKSLMLPEEHTPVASVDVSSGGNWLEVNFDMAGIGTEDIQDILKAAVEKKRYYRLPNGTFVSLETEEFQGIDRMLGELNVKSSEIKEGTIQLPVYRGLQIDDILGDHNQASAKLGKSFRRLVNHLKHPDDRDLELPEALKADLRDYQTTGFQWLHTLAGYGLGGILADDMGLGKTVQAIAYILSRKEAEMTEPILVIAPASLVYNWKNEFAKFAPELVCETVVGSPSERQQLLEKETSPDVWITSYPLLRQDTTLYEKIGFDTLILDEAQAIKNHMTKTFAAVQGVKAPRRFALSGTPIENSLDELWSVFQTIMPGFFPNKTAFGKLSHEQIAKMVRPFILRRLKKDVLKELPDKIETIHESELTREQKALYLGYLEKIQKETKDTIEKEGFQKSRMKILAGLTRLRQICCHPSLFLDDYKGESGKLEQLSEIVEQSVQNGKRLLIFSQFSSMLTMIQERLMNDGYHTFYLDGKTPPKDRVVMADKFNGGEKDIFLISLKAGGTGLNLTGADTVIIYDLWWNPAIEEQAAGRAHRIGQKNVVQVIRLITQGTLEEKIYEMQQKKKELIEKVIQPGEAMLSSFSENDIRDILNI